MTRFEVLPRLKIFFCFMSFYWSWVFKICKQNLFTMLSCWDTAVCLHLIHIYLNVNGLFILLVIFPDQLLLLLFTFLQHLNSERHAMWCWCYINLLILIFIESIGIFKIHEIHGISYLNLFNHTSLLYGLTFLTKNIFWHKIIMFFWFLAVSDPKKRIHKIFF